MTGTIDEARLGEFMGQMAGHMTGGALCFAVWLGDELGLYRALAGAGPLTAQALADATGRPIEVSPVVEATTVGAGVLAGLAAGWWESVDEPGSRWAPRAVVTPQRGLDRDRWREAVARASGWIPDLSALDF
mgnify:CR=1 FL=1